MISTEWRCLKCKEKITFDFNRRGKVALVFALWLAIISMIMFSITMTPLLWIIMVLLCIVGMMYISTYDNFKEAD